MPHPSARTRPGRRSSWTRAGPPAASRRASTRATRARWNGVSTGSSGAIRECGSSACGPRCSSSEQWAPRSSGCSPAVGSRTRSCRGGRSRSSRTRRGSGSRRRTPTMWRRRTGSRSSATRAARSTSPPIRSSTPTSSRGCSASARCACRSARCARSSRRRGGRTSSRPRRGGSTWRSRRRSSIRPARGPNSAGGRREAPETRCSSSWTASTTAPVRRRRRSRRNGPCPKGCPRHRDGSVTTPSARSRSGGRAERGDLAPLGEPAQRLRLELPHALAGDAEDPADLLERLRLRVAAQRVAQLEDPLLALGELRHRVVQRRLRQLHLHLLVGRPLVRGEEVAERRRVALADRLVERRDRARGRPDLANLLHGQLRLLRHLVVRRRTLELRDELALCTRDLRLALHDVDGDADRPRLVRDAALHRLADPPRGVRRELEPLAVVELLGGADQPDDPLLDQVEQRQTVSLVLLRDRDDEAEVRVHHQVLRLLVAALDPLRELDLLRRRQQRIPPGLVEEELEGIGRGGRQRVVAVGDLLLDRTRAVVGEVDPVALEAVEQRLDLLLVQLELLYVLLHLRHVHATVLFAEFDQDGNRILTHGVGRSPPAARTNPLPHVTSHLLMSWSRLLALLAVAASTVTAGGTSAACATSDQVAAFQAATPAARAAFARTHRRAKDRAAWDARRRARLQALERSALSCASGRQLLPFFPQAGIVGRDLYLANTVDLAPGDAIRDPWCGSRTYDGHTGDDTTIRSFREQAIGVPIFAALDGRVNSVQEGNKDTSYGAQTLPWDNHVLLDAGHGQLQVYGHLRRGSVTVKEGDWVVAGQQIGLTGSSGNSSWPHLHFTTMLNFEPTDPWAGPCRPGPSGWAQDPAVGDDLYVRDFTFSADGFAGRRDLPWDEATRTGSFASGRRNVEFRVELGNAASVSSVSVRFVRPDGSTALADDPGVGFSRWRQTWGTWPFDVELDVVGRWRLLAAFDGRTLVDAPFDVAATTLPNRAPAPVTAALTATAAGVRVCTVAQDLVHEDPDYDVVRYRYVWRAGGRVVRAVTSAGLADALARTVRDAVSCTVTPSDGRLSAPPATATG